MVNSRQGQCVTIAKRNQRHRDRFAQKFDTETGKTCDAFNILSKTLATLKKMAIQRLFAMSSITFKQKEMGDN